MRFLGRIEGWNDPTWCYHVYDTYTLQQEQKGSENGNDESEAHEKTGCLVAAYPVANEHFWAVLNMLHVYVANTPCCEQLEPRNQGQIDTLHLQLAVNLPGASLPRLVDGTTVTQKIAESSIFGNGARAFDLRFIYGRFCVDSLEMLDRSV